MSVWNAVLPVVTLILGYLGTVWTESRKDERAREIAKEVREDEASAKHSAERRAFELDTLTQTTEAIADLARAAGREHHFDLMQARATDSAVMPTTQMPADIDQALFDGARRLARLRGLLLDEDARTIVGDFASAVAAHGLAPVPLAEAEQQLVRVMNAADAAQNIVAARIRAIYAGGPVTTS